MLPELACNPVLPDAVSARVPDIAKVDGHACCRIQGAPVRRFGESMIVWIDKASWLLRCLEETTGFDEDVRRHHDESVREILADMAPDDAKRTLLAMSLSRRASSRVKPYTTEGRTFILSE